MTFDTFQKDLETAAKKATESFGVPDRLILQEDVKLWEVTGKVVALRRADTISWPDIVPVFSGSEEIGAASLYPVNGETKAVIMAKASLSAHIPERLDFDMSEPFTLMPEWALKTDEDGQPVVPLRLIKLHLLKARGNNETDPSYWISNEGQL